MSPLTKLANRFRYDADTGFITPPACSGPFIATPLVVWWKLNVHSVEFSLIPVVQTGGVSGFASLQKKCKKASGLNIHIFLHSFGKGHSKTIPNQRLIHHFCLQPKLKCAKMLP
jgi:hypothetical protein